MCVIKTSQREHKRINGGFRVTCRHFYLGCNPSMTLCLKRVLQSTDVCVLTWIQRVQILVQVDVQLDGNVVGDVRNNSTIYERSDGTNRLCTVYTCV